MKLGGWLLVAVGAGLHSHREDLAGHVCYVSKTGPLCVVLDDGTVLEPIPASGVPEQSSMKDGASSSKEPKDHRSGSHESILYHLRLLSAREKVTVEGHTLHPVANNSNNGRQCSGEVLVLFDVSLPTEFWTNRVFWKGGPFVPAVFCHIRNDFADRSRLLASPHAALEGDSYGQQVLGECHVVGCQLHRYMNHGAKQQIFNLPALFKSLPSHFSAEVEFATTIEPHSPPAANERGLWSLPNELLTSILARLPSDDLQNVEQTCRHVRALAATIMPSINLSLYPHQKTALRWMLKRETFAPELPHPFVVEGHTEEGLPYFINMVSGELSLEEPKKVHDFRGGLFCDEPGLGKTVTALSLILKTQGMLAVPPPNAQVHWCPNPLKKGQQNGYYELGNNTSIQTPYSTRSQAANDTLLPLSALFPDSWRSSKRRRLSSGSHSARSLSASATIQSATTVATPAGNATTQQESTLPSSSPAPGPTPRRSLARAFASIANGSPEGASDGSINGRGTPGGSRRRSSLGGVGAGASNGQSRGEASGSAGGSGRGRKRVMSEAEVQDDEVAPDVEESLWVCCDSCDTWRRLPPGSELPADGGAWFCSMNPDRQYSDCRQPQEKQAEEELVSGLQGFCHLAHSGADSLSDPDSELGPNHEQNVIFFVELIRQHARRFTSMLIEALQWLACRSNAELIRMGEEGLSFPREFGSSTLESFLPALHLRRCRPTKGSTQYKWQHPKSLRSGLVLDVGALQEALDTPVSLSQRIYLSRATLVVVPPSLVQHWLTQISRHTEKGRLRVYVWEPSKSKPPPVHTLAWDYDVVITTFNRLSSEWTSRDETALLQVHWLRVMLDEGHTLGAIAVTNKLQMAVALRATYRWILTGTPTPNTPSSHVAHLQPLLRFLHDEVYGECGQKFWEDAIQKPFEGARQEGKIRLQEFLSRIMISANKEDIPWIPKCTHQVKLLEFSKQHAQSYNELVETVRRNLLMADWFDENHSESLLNPKQWKRARQALANVRQSCCVAGHMKSHEFFEDVKETMNILQDNYSLSATSERYAVIQEALRNGGRCDRCKTWWRLPLVTPCMHLLCVGCVQLDKERCTVEGCGARYKMQRPMKREDNPTPKWDVPQDLIELQPSYWQEEWAPNWQSTASTKIAYLIRELKSLEAQGNAPPEDEEEEERMGGSDPSSGQQQEGQGLAICGTGKAKMMFSKEKTIVFSQFLVHLESISEQLVQAGISHGRFFSPVHNHIKNDALRRFMTDPDFTVLLMDNTSALGLDLSFVSRVFLMEPVWDRSIEDQVVSRAHRMGAVRPILVETLAMKGTIEEQMLNLLQDRVQYGGVKSHRENHELTTRYTYLNSLAFINTR